MGFSINNVTKHYILQFGLLDSVIVTTTKTKGSDKKNIYSPKFKTWQFSRSEKNRLNQVES